MRRALTVIAVTALLTGCGAGADVADRATSGRTMTHAFGTTALPDDPRRIVALSFEEDALSTVGLSTVGRTDNAYVAGQPYPWQDGVVDLGETQAVVGADEVVDFERIAALNPDLILATNFYGLDAATYERLSAIAPTVGYREAVGAASWQELATQVGEAVGRPDEMAATVREVEDGIDALAREYPGLRGRNFAGAYHYGPGQFRVNTNPRAQTARVLSELGMTLSPEFVAAAVDRGLSPERLSVLDTDLLVIGFATPALRETLENDPLYANLAVVRDNRVFVGGNDTATASNNPTPLNVPWLLEQQREVLARVASS